MMLPRSMSSVLVLAMLIGCNAGPEDGRELISGGVADGSTVEARLTIPGTPGTPTFTSIAPSSVMVGWTAAKRASAYSLQRAPDAGGVPGEFATIATGLVATSYPDSGLSSGTGYWYRVQGTSSVGSGWYSASAEVTTAAAAQAGTSPTPLSVVSTTAVVSPRDATSTAVTVPFIPSGAVAVVICSNDSGSLEVSSPRLSWTQRLNASGALIATAVATSSVSGEVVTASDAVSNVKACAATVITGADTTKLAHTVSAFSTTSSSPTLAMPADGSSSLFVAKFYAFDVVSAAPVAGITSLATEVDSLHGNTHWWAVNSVPGGGTLTVSGTFSPAVQWKPAGIEIQAATTSTTSTVVTPPLVASPTSASVTALGSQAFTASGGNGPYTWSIPSNRSGGTLSGSSGASVTYTAGATGGVTDTVRVTDSSTVPLVTDVPVSVTVTRTVSGTAPLPSGDLSSLPLGAFPGCQGSGCQTRGGFASGSTTYLVTNLNSSGPGSLQACVSASGPRVCLFRVAGTIDAAYTVGDGNLTIDARSAPPGGIQLTESDGAEPLFTINAPDVVLRGLRLRPSLDTVSPGDPSNKRAIKLYNDSGDVTRMVFDHNSVQWGNATPLDMWVHDTSHTPASEMTWSWNLVAENYWINGNDSTLSRSMIWGCGSGGASTSASVCRNQSARMQNIDLHHNLIASDGYRSPEFKGSSGRLVNNYLYNWGLHAFDVVGTVSADIVGNTFQSGPMHALGQSQGHGTNSPIELNYSGNSSDDDWAVGGCTSGCYYMTGNVSDLQSADTGSSNWTSGISTGVGTASSYQRSSPLATSSTGTALTYDTAANSKAAILAANGAGASYRLDCGGNVVAQRDSEDAAIIAYATSPYTGAPSIAPTAAQTLPAISAIATVCAASTRDNSSAGPDGACVCKDSDSDGIPDYFEHAWMTSDTGMTATGHDLDAGYTNLEMFLSGQKGKTSY